MNPSLDKLKAVFAAYPQIEAVYLFGSQVGGKTHRHSDIDLAIYPDSETIRGKKADILYNLAKNGFCNVDLVFMNPDDIVLLYEIVRLNRLVFQRSGFDRGFLFSKVIRQYFDFYPYLSIQRKAYKNRILNGPPGSHPKTA